MTYFWDSRRQQWRQCHPLHGHVGWQAFFFFVHSCWWQWPASALAGIDIFAYSPGAAWQLPRGNCVWETEHGLRDRTWVHWQSAAMASFTFCSRLTTSSPSFPFRRLDSPSFLIPGCFDDCILPTPHFSTRLPYSSSLRHLGSSP